MQTGKEHLRRQVARERKRERIMSGEREKAMPYLPTNRHK